MRKLLYISFLILLELSSFQVRGQDIYVPRIKNFTRDLYRAANQNWMITQALDGRYFIANSQGVLEFDGMHWWLHRLPKNRVTRVVLADGKRIYAGGYEEVGYFDYDPQGHFVYHSLTDLLPEGSLINQDIWHIEKWNNAIYFQSFSQVLKFSNNQMEVYVPPSTFMLGTIYQDRYIIPGIQDNFYQLDENGKIEFLAKADILQNDRVAALLNHPDGNLIICSQKTGLFTLDDNSPKPLNVAINELLINSEINRALALSDGRLVFGTIQNGIIITDKNYNLLYQLNKSNGLQNNTVLSLFEDDIGGLWVGLDQGISHLQLNSPLSFYYDVAGNIGRVFTSIVHQDDLYVGSNQGLFVQKKGSSNFDIIPGTEGQVWDLKVYNGQLLCGHNYGTFTIRGDSALQISNITGGWKTIRHPLDSSLLLQSTYTGFVVYNFSDNGWRFDHQVPGLTMGYENIIPDPRQSIIWGQHPHKGVYQIFYPDLKSGVTSNISLADKYKLPISSDLEIRQIDQKIIAKIDHNFFQLELDTFYHKRKMDSEFNSISVYGQDTFYIKKNQIQYKNKAFQAEIPFQVDSRYHQILPLDSVKYLISQDDAFSIFNISEIPADPVEASYPIIVKISIDGGPFLSPSPDQIYKAKSYGNQVTIHASLPYVYNREELYLDLPGVLESAQPLIDGKKTLVSLPKGTHKFTVFSNLSPSNSLIFNIQVLPKWYETRIAKVIYILSSIILLYILYKLHLHTIAKEKSILLAEQERIRKEQQILSRNKQLQTEVRLKSSQLADSTMNLVKKNELLTELKTQILSLPASSIPTYSRDFQKLLRRINRNISSDEDWHVFEQNFNAVHEDFLKKLKKEHPILTPGDLRLAAYLKMDLSSKEIAPLLNISIRAVENKRYRLRKKLNLPKDENLVSFMIQY